MQCLPFDPTMGLREVFIEIKRRYLKYVIYFYRLLYYVYKGHILMKYFIFTCEIFLLLKQL